MIVLSKWNVAYIMGGGPDEYKVGLKCLRLKTNEKSLDKIQVTKAHWVILVKVQIKIKLV